jgi:hypothetical protein
MVFDFGPTVVQGNGYLFAFGRGSMTPHGHRHTTLFLFTLLKPPGYRRISCCPPTRNWALAVIFSRSGSGHQMKKHRKTARELADMIIMKMNLAGLRVEIHKESVEWHPIIYGYSPDLVARAQAQADRIADDLRACYDLAE